MNIENNKYLKKKKILNVSTVIVLYFEFMFKYLPELKIKTSYHCL